MKTKHTPGTWKAVKDTSLSVPTTEIYTNSTDVVNIMQPIMRIRHNEESLLQVEYNAKLIAAAPELLEVAIEVIKIWNEDGENGEIQMKTPIAWTRAIRKAEEAIKKAITPQTLLDDFNEEAFDIERG